MSKPVPKPEEFCAVVLAGGRGTRFWPRSRRHAAKQVLNILGEGTMLEQTLTRLAPVAKPDNTWIITNRELRAAVLRQAPKVPPQQVIAEPVPRNTAAAIALGAELILRTRGDVPMGVFPSDHVIAHPQKFANILRIGIQETKRPGRLVVLGIPPARPETGYGYIEVIEEPHRREPPPVFRVRRFLEKPDLQRAREFVAAGNYYWNAGIFLWRASSILEALAEHLPEISERLRRVAEAPRSKFTAALERWYPGCQNISIDYGVLEKARGLVCLPAGGMGWNDLGSWAALYEELAPNGGTVTQGGSVVELDAANNYVQAPGKTVALIGVKDFVVVETPDALLIVPRTQAQKVGKLVQELEKQGKDKLL